MKSLKYNQKCRIAKLDINIVMGNIGEHMAYTCYGKTMVNTSHRLVMGNMGNISHRLVMFEHGEHIKKHVMGEHGRTHHIDL